MKNRFVIKIIRLNSYYSETSYAGAIHYVSLDKLNLAKVFDTWSEAYSKLEPIVKKCGSCTIEPIYQI